MPTAAIADTAIPPPLLADLAEPILVLAIRLAAPLSLWQPAAIAKPLNVLSCTHVPLVTKAALMQMPHINLTSATRLGDINLLDFMLAWSKQPAGRPLNYNSHDVISFALKCESPHVLEWWLDRPGVLFLNWDWSEDQLMETFCEREDRMWLEWWKARGYPYLELEEGDGASTFARITKHASTVGRVDILEWLLENAGPARMASARREYGRAISGAAFSGRVQVLEWWVAMSQAGVIDAKVDWMEIFSSALYRGQAAVLGWCNRQPAAMEAWRQGVRAAKEAGPSPSSPFSFMCYGALRSGLGREWLDSLDLLPFAQGNVNVSREACEMGDTDLVKELHSQGYLMGSRKQLVQFSLQSGNLELLEWIQANIDPSVAERSEWSSGIDLFEAACDTGCVDILDWLLMNGFQFPPPGRSRARIFRLAAYNGRIDVLEWLFKNGFAKDMSMEDWSGCFASASGKGCLDVLDWLAERIPRIDGMKERPSRIEQSGLLWDVFSQGQVEVLEWWFFKSGWLKDDVYDLSCDTSVERAYLRACDTRDFECDAASKLAALKVWVNAGQPVDFAKCIHQASVNGRIDMLDWLLRSTTASEQDFAKAWSSDEFPDAETEENMYCHYWYDIENHDKSLLWWYSNLPHICTQLPVNRGPCTNPIHAHLFKHMLKNTSSEVLDPFNTIDELLARVSVLDYWRRHCTDEEMEELKEDQSRCLEVASRRGLCDVLEWFKVASGICIKCPEDILAGKTEISRRAKAWWAQSGLVDEKQLAIKTRKEFNSP